MILSDTIKVKYKLNTCGLQTHEVAKLLRDKGVKGFVISSNDRNVIVAVPREDIKRNRKIMEGIYANETIHSLASSRNHTDNRAIDNVDNYVREWRG